ncbi:MAG: DUF885 domain-containing protein [Pseudomonadota bacterium]
MSGNPLASSAHKPTGHDPADTSGSVLAGLCDDYWAFCCEEQPFSAILAGEVAEDNVLYRESLADHDRRAQRAAELLSRAVNVEWDGATSQDRATLKLLQSELQLVLDLHSLDAHLRPSLFPATPDFNLSYLASALPVNNRTQAERYVALLQSAPRYIDDVRESLLHGVEAGYRNARLAIERGADAVEANLRSGFRETMLEPLERAVATHDLSNAKLDAAQVLDDALAPALQALVDALRGPLWSAARETEGLSTDRNGEALYRTLCRQFTSLDLPPEEIHALGLEEVSRLVGEQEALAISDNFRDLPSYRSHLEKSGVYTAVDRDQHLAAVRALCKRIDGEIPGFFSQLPRITYGVELIPEARADSTPPAYAQPSPGDGSRPGIFWLTPQLEKCPTFLYPSLALHEAWPGHLMQIALMQEQSELPAFRRNGSLKYTACIEGWAMYCEWLGEEMGIYKSSAERFGRLNMELWRAVRLVVDTGIHLMGWSREKAVRYMNEYVTLPDEAIASEIDRYIALPGQALAYQLGNRSIRGLRQRAEDMLKENFDLRGFHDQLISSGPVSLEVLESLTQDWIDVKLETAG